MPVYPMSGATSPASNDHEIISARTSIEPLDDGTDVVEIHGSDADTFLITEPVSVDPAAMGLHADDLVDVDGVAAAPADTPLVLFKGSDGVLRPIHSDLIAHVHWGEEIRFGEGEPEVLAPTGATWVDYQTGTIYKAGETA